MPSKPPAPGPNLLAFLARPNTFAQRFVVAEVLGPPLGLRRGPRQGFAGGSTPPAPAPAPKATKKTP